MIRSVAILGPGLLGGSIALAVRERLPEVDLRLWGRREVAVAQARELGIVRASTNLQEVVAGAELIILATPVGVMAQMVERVVESRVGETFLITDVGSVKRLPHQMIEPLLEDTDVTFIGSHPMAGSERAGIEAANKDLLDGAACILTGEKDRELQCLEVFWTALGCRMRRLTPEDHDYAVARISHFPHLLASVGATVGLAFEDIADLAGGGLRDTTRVAAGDADLWTEILLENSDALQRSVGESIKELEKLRGILQDKAEPDLHAYLAAAKRKRELLSS